MEKRFNDPCREELTSLRCAMGFERLEFCAGEERDKCIELQQKELPLPDGVKQLKVGEESVSQFYRLEETDLKPEEKTEFLLFKGLQFLKTIKNCVVFFTVLTVLGMVACLLYLFS